MKNQEHNCFKELQEELQKYKNISDSKLKEFAYMSLKAEILRINLVIEEGLCRANNHTKGI